MNQPDPQQDFDFLRTLERARSGEVGAFDALVDRFYRRVNAQVHNRLAFDLRVGRPWLAARFSTGDVVHEVFLSVIKNLGSFGGETEDAFCGYLAMIVRNRIIDSIRFHESACRDGRQARPLVDGMDEIDGTLVDPAVWAARVESLQSLEDSMGGLPEREQLLVRARFEDVATFEDLANQLGYGSESTARRAYFDALAALAVQLRSSDCDEDLA